MPPEPDAMAEAGSRLLRDTDTRRATGAAAVTWAALFTWERAAREVMAALAGA
jgi:glycosyltransferase involved in cell wall biosynthesis